MFLRLALVLALAGTASWRDTDIFIYAGRFQAFIISMAD
jgi:hypothetical protein